MAERFYLRDTQVNQSGTLPTAEQSTALPNGTAHNPTFARRDLGRSIGAATVEVVHTHASDTLHHDGLMRMFVSEPLPALTVAANTWTLAVQGNESSTSADTYTNYVLYVWRPGTGAKVGTGIFDAHSGAQITNGNGELAGTGRVITFAGTAQAVQAGDVLVLEVWHHWLQTMASAYTSTLSYGGSVAVTAGGAGTGSYLETPQTLFSQTFTETGRQVTAAATVEARDILTPPVGHDEYFLHRADTGAKEVFVDFPYLFWANVANTAYRTAAQRHLSGIASDGFDGVMLDDTNMQPGHGWTDGMFTELANQAAYRTAVVGMMSGLSSAIRAQGGMVVAPNVGMDPWDTAAYAGYTSMLTAGSLDVSIREFWMAWGGGVSTIPFTGTAWVDVAKIMVDAEANGVDIVCNTLPLATPDPARSIRYGLASFYAHWNGTSNSGFAHAFANELTYLSEYRKNIGTPTEAKQLVTGTATDGAWMRHYTKGVVIINARDTAGLVTFTLGGTYVDPTGANVTSVQLNQGHGMVLLSTDNTEADYDRLIGFYTGSGEWEKLLDPAVTPTNRYRYVGVQWNVGPEMRAAIKARHPNATVLAYQDLAAMQLGPHGNDRPATLVTYEDAIRLTAEELTEPGRQVTAAATVTATDRRWGPPLNLQATAVSTSQINLAWDAVTAASGYDIERDGAVVVSDHPTTSYNDTGLAAATGYNYRVRAVG